MKETLKEIEMKISGKEYRIKPLEWVETHGGAWLRAESGKHVYEINTFGTDIEAEKVACQTRHDEYVLSLVEEYQSQETQRQAVGPRP
jgi:hypothetical protein